MNLRELFIPALLAVALTGCAHSPVPVSPSMPPAASAAGVTAAISGAKSSQQHAESQVRVIESKVSDPELHQEIVDLHSTINDLGLKLDDATGKIAWYEQQYQTLYADDVKVHGERDWFQKDDETHIAGETFWRKRAQVILYALAVAFAVWFYGEARKICVSPVTGLLGLMTLFVAGAIGAAIGYAFGLYVLGWFARFLP